MVGSPVDARRFGASATKLKESHPATAAGLRALADHIDRLELPDAADAMAWLAPKSEPDFHDQEALMKTAWLPVVAFVMSPLTGWSGESGEVHVSMDQLPDAVKATIRKETAGAVVKEIERESEGGKPFYEAEFETEDGHTLYIHVAEDGKVLKRETAAEERKEERREKEGDEGRTR